MNFNKIDIILEHHLHVPSVLKKQTITQAAVLISVLALISKFIGFFREVLIANYFGATGQTDAFVVAMLIPGSILGSLPVVFLRSSFPFIWKESLEAKKQPGSLWTLHCWSGARCSWWCRPSF